MAVSLLQPLALTDLSAINPLTDRSPTSAAAISRAAVADSTSSVVRLSSFGRFLAATAAPETPPIATSANPTGPVVTAAAQTAGSNTDILAAGQSASAATSALQSLVNDPALRAIANNQFNPVYSALMAAAHQTDFMTPQAVARAIPADIPEPVLPVAPTEAISSYIEAAQAFVRRRAQENG